MSVIGVVSEKDGKPVCIDCGNDNLYPLTLNSDETVTITNVSNDENLVLAMDKLKQQDIIEFNMKMAQFKLVSNNESDNSDSTTNNKPKCPTCGSTNIKRITGVERAGSVGFFGLFSKKINKSFECNNCKYTW